MQGKNGADPIRRQHSPSGALYPCVHGVADYCPVCVNTLKATFKTYPGDRNKEYNSYRCNNSRLRLCPFAHGLSERRIEKYLLTNIRSHMDS